MEEAKYMYLNFMQDYAAYAPYEDTCTEQELDEIERSLNIKLPRAYRELCLIIGKKRAFTMADNSFNYPDYQQMREAAIALVSDDDEVEVNIDENVFVFTCNLELSAIGYFPLNEGDDPPVYEYAIGYDEPEKMAEHLSEYVKRLALYAGHLYRKDKAGKQ
jgi:hypothetical protein